MWLGSLTLTRTDDKVQVGRFHMRCDSKEEYKVWGRLEPKWK